MLSCSHVVGYREATTIHDDVCIMAVTGTAVALRNVKAAAVPPVTVEAETQVQCDSNPAVPQSEIGSVDA